MTPARSRQRVRLSSAYDKIGGMETAFIGLAALLAAVAVGLAVLLARAREGAARAGARAGDAEAQIAALSARLDEATAARFASERAVAVAEEQRAAGERRLADFERVRQEAMTAAKAAVLETAGVLSSKLIDDHKRESEAARQAGEARVREASEQLLKQVGDIARAVAELNGQVQDKGRVLDTVWRSLSSPGGAGQIAEIGLANTLRDFGLEAGRDYLLQATTTDDVTGQRLRPDAIVFLPGNGAIIIDCKASKYLLEIAEAEADGGERERQAYANLARTMNAHLKALSDKNYRGAVQAAWRDGGRGGEIGRLLSMMYLPNEGAIDKLYRADPEFPQKARAAQIIPAGPAGLHCALSLAAAEIIGERQAENQQRILVAATELIDGVVGALSHVGAVGRAIKSAAESYARLTGSLNARLLPRARRMTQLGVQPARPLPGNLPAYVVMTPEADGVIEGESAEVEQPPLPRLLAE